MIDPNNSIFIECCHNCAVHTWCTVHKEERYKQFLSLLKDGLANNFPDINVYVNLDPNTNKPVEPTLGSFEVFFKGQLIFSKLSEKVWPRINRIYEKVKILKDFNDKSVSEIIYHTRLTRSRSRGAKKESPSPPVVRPRVGSQQQPRSRSRHGNKEYLFPNIDERGSTTRDQSFFSNFSNMKGDHNSSFLNETQFPSLNATNTNNLFEYGLKNPKGKLYNPTTTATSTHRRAQSRQQPRKPNPEFIFESLPSSKRNSIQAYKIINPNVFKTPGHNDSLPDIQVPKAPSKAKDSMTQTEDLLRFSQYRFNSRLKTTERSSKSRYMSERSLQKSLEESGFEVPARVEEEGVNEDFSQNNIKGRAPSRDDIIIEDNFQPGSSRNARIKKKKRSVRGDSVSDVPDDKSYVKGSSISQVKESSLHYEEEWDPTGSENNATVGGETQRLPKSNTSIGSKRNQQQQVNQEDQALRKRLADDFSLKNVLQDNQQPLRTNPTPPTFKVISTEDHPSEKRLDTLENMKALKKIISGGSDNYSFGGGGGNDAYNITLGPKNSSSNLTSGRGMSNSGNRLINQEDDYDYQSNDNDRQPDSIIESPQKPQKKSPNEEYGVLQPKVVPGNSPKKTSGRDLSPATLAPRLEEIAEVESYSAVREDTKTKSKKSTQREHQPNENDNKSMFDDEVNHTTQNQHILSEGSPSQGSYHPVSTNPMLSHVNTSSTMRYDIKLEDASPSGFYSPSIRSMEGSRQRGSIFDMPFPVNKVSVVQVPRDKIIKRKVTVKGDEKEDIVLKVYTNAPGILNMESNELSIAKGSYTKISLKFDPQQEVTEFALFFFRNNSPWQKIVIKVAHTFA